MYVVIMAGGKGSRFWPRSRVAKPKQLIDIVYRTTMLQATVERVLPMVALKHIIIVTGAEHEQLLRAQVPDIPPENILIEPVGRNTAPCICLAALHIASRDPESSMVVLPADHYIAQPDAFRTSIALAVTEAETSGSLVTIGIKPLSPETGFGYIEYAAPDSCVHGGAYPVTRFHEKPDLAHARMLVARKNVFWNSGMFVWKTCTILDALQRHLPDVYHCLAAIDIAPPHSAYQRSIAEAYAKMPAVSIDYGVLEKSDQVKTVPGDFGWNDIGSWSAVYDLSDKDAGGNVFRGAVKEIDAHNVLVDAPSKFTALIGVQNLVIVDTGDCLLVCSRKHVQDVGKIVSMLELEGLKQYL
jgi:mannose-1-phosphate guanylyltransferase